MNGPARFHRRVAYCMKKRTLVTILLLIFINSAFAESFMEFLKKKSAGFLPDTLVCKSGKLNYDVSHQELFRSTLGDSLLSRYTFRQQKLDFYYPANRFYLNTSVKRSLLNISDFFNVPDQLIMNPRPVFYDLSITVSFPYKDWLLKPSLESGFFSGSDTAFVLQYPRSETDAYNAYFFNLLPDAFGDIIPYRTNLRHGSAMIELHKKTQYGRWFFKYQFEPGHFTLKETHVNKSSYEKLKGPRESKLSLKTAKQTLAVAWQNQKHSAFSLKYQSLGTPLDWRHTVFPAEPDTLEIVKLLNGKTKAHFLNTAYRYQNEGLTLEAHAGGGMFNADASASTPVLGYLFYILPISHQANAEAAMRFMHMQVYFNYRFSLGVFNFTPRLDLYAARFYSDISLNAELEFGLEDIQFQQNYIHALYLVSPGLISDIALNPDLHIHVNAEQLIPFFKTVYPEITPPVPDDIRRYGGLSVSAGVSLQW